MKKGRNLKEGQMKLSFGMIFSIILIILFVSFAFFAIGKVLGLRDHALLVTFADDLGDNVDAIWKGSQGSQKISLSLSGKVQKFCFMDHTSLAKGPNEDLHRLLKQVFFDVENSAFYPVGSGGGLDALNIMHIDLDKIIANENPFCLDNEKGKINMVLKKDFGENLVTITR